MKNFIFRRPFLLPFVIALLPFTYGGCSSDQDENAGYHYIVIPSYGDSDYMVMLDSRNEEMQYNAICYLNENSSTNKDIINTDSLKGTRAYDSTLNIYKKIYPLMNSKNSWVSSAAIRYCQKSMYQRAKFINDILSINSPSKNVQLEIIYTILYDTVRNDEMKYKKFVFLQQQPSWLLQNSSYGVSRAMTNPPVEKLIKEYKGNAEDYKKLLIMDVLLANITDTVFTFLADEYASSKDERIKEMIEVQLAGAQNEELAYQWYAGHYNLVEKYIQIFIEALFNHGSNVYRRIVRLALEKGWNPSSFTVDENEWAEGKPLLYKELYDAKMEDYQDDTSRVIMMARVKIIEDALLDNPVLKNEWESFQAWAKGITLPAELIKKHEELTRLYLEQTDRLFLQYKVDTSHIEGFKKEINTQAGSLQSLKYRQ